MDLSTSQQGEDTSRIRFEYSPQYSFEVITFLETHIRWLEAAVKKIVHER